MLPTQAESEEQRRADGIQRGRAAGKMRAMGVLLALAAVLLAAQEASTIPVGPQGGIAAPAPPEWTDCGAPPSACVPLCACLGIRWKGRVCSGCWVVPGLMRKTNQHYCCSCQSDGEARLLTGGGATTLTVKSVDVSPSIVHPHPSLPTLLHPHCPLLSCERAPQMPQTSNGN